MARLRRGTRPFRGQIWNLAAVYGAAFGPTAGAGVAAGGGGGALTRGTPLGLLSSDDFSGAASTFPPPGWTELNGGYDDDVKQVFGRAGHTGLGLRDDGFTAGEMMVQTSIGVDGGSIGMPGICARSLDGANAYWLELKILSSNEIILLKRVAGVDTVLNNLVAASMLLGSTQYKVQLYTADGVQEAAAITALGLKKVSAADTAFNGLNSRFGGFITRNAGNKNLFAESGFGWLAFSTKNIVVTGLTAGSKVKVLNAAAAVVAQATESSGTATVDCSLFGTATEVVPFNSTTPANSGWPDIIVTDGSDVELTRFTPSGVQGVCPGDVYSMI